MSSSRTHDSNTQSHTLRNKASPNQLCPSNYVLVYLILFYGVYDLTFLFKGPAHLNLRDFEVLII